jgi:hypothetical protein
MYVTFCEMSLHIRKNKLVRKSAAGGKNNIGQAAKSQLGIEMKICKGFDGPLTGVAVWSGADGYTN